MAQWIARVTSDHEVVGLSPIWVDFLLNTREAPINMNTGYSTDATEIGLSLYSKNNQMECEIIDRPLTEPKDSKTI